jgi:aryl-alcohol dehydrogenase-like predicted oxidoreductase
MRQRPFGKHGFSVSEIGFGGWAIGGGWGAQREADSLAALNRALDLGCSFIDTAAGYGDGRSERVIASVLAQRKQAGDERAAFVATKIPPSDGPWPPSPYCRADERYGESYLHSRLEERLSNLGTSRIDLLQLHTWTRAWNRDPAPLRLLRAMQREGSIGLVGISTPEHDQNCAIDLMRNGWVDSVQVIYNLFDQEPAAELLDVARECGVAVIVRVALDEGALSGKFTSETRFGEGDFRNDYFAGDRLERTVARTNEIRGDLEGSGYTMAEAALKWVLAHPAVSVVIPGMRTAAQAKANCRVSQLPDMPAALVERLRRHNWRRGIWYEGK